MITFDNDKYENNNNKRRRVRRRSSYRRATVGADADCGKVKLSCKRNNNA